MKTSSSLRYVALLLGLLLGPVVISPVLAHAVAVRTTPKDRAVLTSVPPEIEIRFNATLEKKLAHVKLERADGSTQTLVDEAKEPAVLRCVLPRDLISGAYVLTYKVLATDGHATEGVLRFTLKLPVNP